MSDETVTVTFETDRLEQLKKPENYLRVIPTIIFQ